MKRETDFRFKQFSVAQDRCTHKVGTDGVLLGAWVNIHSAIHILDVGCGTGVIALMLAQRSAKNAHIDAVEISGADARQATENVQHSPWPDKITVHHTAIQQFHPRQSYDLIVSNPPFFIKSLHAPEERRTESRHTTRLTFEDLVGSATRMLKKEGRLAVVLPYAEGKQFIQIAGNNNLFLIRECSFRSRENKPVERLLLEFSCIAHPPEISRLTLYSGGDSWSAEYGALIRNFYLKIHE